MKVIKMKDLPAERKVSCPHGHFISYRGVLESDGMGYTVTKTVIPKGDPVLWHYKNHLESCYCVSGTGTLVNWETGEEYEIGPDSLYVLDKHDAHVFQAHETVTLICVFNPPLTGREVHQADGSYSLKETTNV
jgi:L-ectoine synthase